mgnify:CR=1 FL=1
MRKKFGLGGGILTLGGIKKAASKKIAKTAAERKDQLLNIIKKARGKKLFGSGKIRRETVKMKMPDGSSKTFKDESKIMDSDTYDKIKNMSDKNVTSQLKQAGFKDK